MTDNLVSAISRFLTPELIGKMASVSGLDRGTTQSAVGASVPAILGSLADLVAKPGGARQLSDMIAEQPSAMLSNLPQILGTAGMSAEKGGGMLSSLLGGGVLNALVSTLSRFVGIGEGSMRTLMGLLAPVVLGVLGREQRAAGVETGGLARMLMGQKDQITAAMPAGLSDLLSSRVRTQEGAETIRPEGRTYTEGRSYDEGRRYEAPETARPAPTSARRPVEARDVGGQWNWAYWVIPLLALGGLLWYLLPGSQTERTATAPTTQTMPTDGSKVAYFAKAAPEWTPVGVYYQQDIYNRAGEKIGSVKDLMVGRDGRIHAAVLNVGQFLGLGERHVAVPMSALTVDKRPDGTRITIDVKKDALQNAPAFQAGSAK